MCLRPNYWDTNESTTVNKLLNDIKKAYGKDENNYTCWTRTGAYAACSYGNNFFYVFRDGRVQTLYQQSPSNVWCQIDPDDQAHCGG